MAASGLCWNLVERRGKIGYCQSGSRCSRPLSPYTINGTHEASDGLCADAIETIHRLTTDASRCTENWVADITSGELSDEQYIEIVSIVATISGLDTFDQALGRNIRELPRPVTGNPTRQRPSGAVKDIAWVATLSPETVGEDEPNPFPLHGSIHIHRAMSLVPQEVINFFDLDVELYLKDHEIRDFEHEFREISHAQIELIAGRASAINGCYY